MKTKLEYDKDQIGQYKLSDLKEFLSTLSEEQLQQPVRIAFEDCPVQNLWGHEVIEEDYYHNINDSEDCGTLSELREIHQYEFKEDEYEVSLPKGTVIFY